MGSVEKQRSIIDFTLSSLMRRKGKNTALLTIYYFGCKVSDIMEYVPDEEVAAGEK